MFMGWGTVIFKDDYRLKVEKNTHQKALNIRQPAGALLPACIFPFF